MSFYRTENIARVYGPTGRHLGTIADERYTRADGDERVVWNAYAGGNALAVLGPGKAQAVAAVLSNAHRCGIPPREVGPNYTVTYIDPSHWKGAA